MFEPNHESWERFQERIAEICGECEFVLKADILNYFERLPQHNLVNLMSAAGCAPEVVSLLEERLGRPQLFVAKKVASGGSTCLSSLRWQR